MAHSIHRNGKRGGRSPQTLHFLDGSGVGEWDLKELAAHTMRSVALPGRFLAEPEPEMADLESPLAYFLSYLDGGEDMRNMVADRGRQEAESLTTDPATAFQQSLVTSLAAIGSARVDRRLATPFGSLSLDDYLATRVFELTVHGFDLAEATSITFQPPVDAVRITLQLLVDVAMARGRAENVIGALCGGHWAGDPGVFS